MKTKFEHQLYICKAAEAGEAIQYYDPAHLKWVDLEDRYHLFNFGYNSYRVKIKETITIRKYLIYQYLIQDKNGFYHETTQFFESADDCKKHFPYARVIQCLPNTEIEITKEQP